MGSGRFDRKQTGTFVVTGRGPFPMDMMRYAQAAFHRDEDREEAEASQDVRKWGYNTPYRVVVRIEGYDGWFDAVAARFASFGAKMTPAA